MLLHMPASGTQLCLLVAGQFAAQRELSSDKQTWQATAGRELSSESYKSGVWLSCWQASGWTRAGREQGCV